MAGDDVTSWKANSELTDPLSPFYLGDDDVPWINISQIKLKSDNYDNWSKFMRVSLKSRRKFGFCDGTIKKPEDKLLREQWEVVNCTIVQWLRNSIDTSILDSVPFVEDAAVFWKDLEERFAVVVDGTTIYSLKTDLYNCKQTKGMSVTTYYRKLKSLWDALIAYEPPLACKCGKCTCDLASQAINRLDNEHLYQFFMGLDSELYGAFRRQQLQLDPLPSVTHAYHAALQVERLIESDGASRTIPYWKAIREKEKLERRKMLCSHCNVRGHDIHSCFIKQNKFPDWWGDRPRSLTGLYRGRRSRQGARSSG